MVIIGKMEFAIKWALHGMITGTIIGDQFKDGMGREGSGMAAILKEVAAGKDAAASIRKEAAAGKDVAVSIRKEVAAGKDVAASIRKDVAENATKEGS